MRNDKQANEILPAPSQRRRRTLANITNLSLSASWASESRDGPVKAAAKRSTSSEAAELREENAALKRLLSEKEAAIAIQAGQLDQMHKDFFAQLRRYTQVNEELISYNSRLAKDGGQLREQLKLLQHEHCQMTAVYKISQSEVQAKLAESQELLTRLLQHGPTASPLEQSMPLKISTRPRSRSTQRRHSVGNLMPEDECSSNSSISTHLGIKRAQEGGKMSDFRTRRSSSLALAPRELRTKSRQAQKAENSAAVATYTVQHQQPNLYGELIGLGPMPEDDCEAESPSGASSLNSEDSYKGGTSAAESGQTCESYSRSRRACSSGDESVADSVAPPTTTNTTNVKRPQSSNTNKILPKETSVAKTSISAVPHFSRRATSSSISSLNNTGNGRPVRRAAEKILSYTEPALNTKMRRQS